MNILTNYRVLKEIENIIQGEENKHRVGKIVYSTIGVGSGAVTLAGIIAAPYTLGASLILSIIGGAMGVATAGAGATHAFVKEGVIAKHIAKAEEEIKNHQKDCELLSNAIKRFGSKIRKILPFVNESGKCVSLGLSIQKLACASRAMHLWRSGSSVDKVCKVFQTGQNLEKIIKPSTSALTNGISNAAKASAGIFGALAAAGIVVDIFTIANNAHKLHRGIRHEKVRQIEDTIHTIKREQENVSESIEDFKKTTATLNKKDLKDTQRYFHNLKTLQNAEPGDLIEFKRIIYSHWGVYKGDGKVIHFTIVGRKCKRQEDDFWDLVQYFNVQSKATIKNKWDYKYKPLEPHVILKNANQACLSVDSFSRVDDDEHPYHVIEQNCEHFATWCRYGISISDQGQAAEDTYVAINTMTAGLRAIGSLSLTIANIVMG